MKKPYKVMALSTLIATIVGSGIMPSYASANEPAPIYENQNQNQNQNPNYPSYYLGPTGLEHALRDTKSNMLVMDLYALTILKQSNINMDGIPAVNDTLKTEIKANQQLTRENAEYWLKNLKPGLIQTNQNVISYDTKYQNYHKLLLKYRNNPTKLKTVLTNLNKDISAYKDQVTNLVNEMTNFRTKLGDDTKNLKGNADKIVNLLTGEEAGIPLYQKQIEANKIVIDENNKIYIASSVATAAGAFMVLSPLAPIGAPVLGAGIYGVVSSQQQIIKAQEQIITLTQNVSMAKLQVGRLTIVESDIKNLTATIDKAIDSLETIKTSWETMGSKYTTFIDRVTGVSPDVIELDDEEIPADLKTVQDEWTKIRQYAETIQNGEIKFVNK